MSSLTGDCSGGDCVTSLSYVGEGKILVGGYDTDDEDLASILETPEAESAFKLIGTEPCGASSRTYLGDRRSQSRSDPNRRFPN